MTKRIRSKLIFLVVALLSFIGCRQAQQDNKQVELWANRAVATIAKLVSDPNVDKYELDYYVSMAALALGQNGREEDAIKLLDRIGLGMDEGKRQKALMNLADGLSTGDFVDAALSQSSKIENENLRATTICLVAIRQSQRGDFEDAVKLLEQIPDQESRDRAIAQICQEFAQVSKYEDAQNLCLSIADSKTRDDMLARIEKRKLAPSPLDENYVSAQINDAKDSAYVRASTAELEFLKHFYQAEVAHATKDTQRFDAEAKTAQVLALEMIKNDGALLRLAGLMFKAKRRDEAKSLYLKLFDNYLTKKEDLPALDFNQMLFGSGRESDAWIAANCLTDLELRAYIEKLSARDNTIIVAAPIYAAVVQRSNPSWAEDLYRDARSDKLKAEFAINCLFAFALRP